LITKDMLISQVVASYPATVSVFHSYGITCTG
jgi:hypothetical protein